MQESDKPTPVKIPFASSGLRSPIPDTSTTTGEASKTNGFPGQTMTPIASGGVPPRGRQVNEALYQLALRMQWIWDAGYIPTWDAATSANIGGYPKKATVSKADGAGLWQSTVQNNTTNPDTGGAGWVDITPGAYNKPRIVELFQGGAARPGAIGWSYTAPAGTGLTDVFKIEIIGGASFGVAGRGAYLSLLASGFVAGDTVASFTIGSGGAFDVLHPEYATPTGTTATVHGANFVAGPENVSGSGSVWGQVTLPGSIPAGVTVLESYSGDLYSSPSAWGRERTAELGGPGYARITAVI